MNSYINLYNLFLDKSELIFVCSFCFKKSFKKVLIIKTKNKTFKVFNTINV